MSEQGKQWWRETFEKFDSPIDKFQFLCGLKELSWDDCQDAWFESQKLMPEIAKSHAALLEKAREAEEIIKFYADNRGLRINFESNKFESADSDGKDFHGAMARKYIEKHGVR